MLASYQLVFFFHCESHIRFAFQPSVGRGNNSFPLFRRPSHRWTDGRP